MCCISDLTLGSVTLIDVPFEILSRAAAISAELNDSRS